MEDLTLAMVKLIGLVNSVFVILFQMTLLICLIQMVISVSIDFLSNLKGDAPFHCKDIANTISCI